MDKDITKPVEPIERLPAPPEFMFQFPNHGPDIFTAPTTYRLKFHQHMDH